MTKVLLAVWGYRCERCEHEWIPRDTENEPRVCPKCKSPYWNKPRKAVKPPDKQIDAPAHKISV